MSNKIHPIALVFVGLLFSVAAAEVSADASAELEQAKSNIISLVNGGNYAQAQTQTQKLLADFPKNPALPQALYEIAERFRWSDKSDKYECAKGLYQQIIQNYPDSPFVSKANLGIAKVKVLSLIVAQDFNKAEEALDEMIANFSNNPDLPEELYWIGRGFGYWERYEDEKNTAQQILQNYPDSPFVDKARLAFARANVQSLIMSQDYDQAKEALDKLIADFSNHPDLPEELYWLANRYKYSDKYEQAQSLYQQIIKNYPDNRYASKAKLGVPTMNAMSLIMTQDYNQTDKALDKMLTDFKDHPDLPKTLLFMGERCYKQGLSEEKEGLADKAKDHFEKAAKIWDRLIKEFPASSTMPEACSWAGDCYFKLGKPQDSIRCFQKVVDDYPQYKHAWHAQFTIGRCYDVLKDTAYKQLLEKYPDCPAAEQVRRLSSNKIRVQKEEEK
jgi:TolA-binding protein